MSDADSHSSQRPPLAVCPQCGAVLRGRGCALCGAAPADETATGRPSPHEDSLVHTFAFSRLMLLLAILFVGLGVAQVAPGLGIVLGIGALPLLVRTAFLARKRRAAQAAQEEPAVADAVVDVESSLTTIALSVLAGIIAFGAACGASCAALDYSEDYGPAFLLMTVAPAVGVGTTVWLLYRDWQRRQRPRRH